MGNINSLEKVMEHELKDIYSAENQLLKALPKMAKKANSTALKEAFQAHLEETQVQVERLQRIGAILQIKLTGKTCKGMQGIIEEGKEIMEEENKNQAFADLLLIAAAQKVEHYEIAAYGTIRAMAQELDLTEVADLIQESLDEEGNTDKELTRISQEDVMVEATAYSLDEISENADHQSHLSQKRSIKKTLMNEPYVRK